MIETSESCQGVVTKAVGEGVLGILAGKTGLPGLHLAPPTGIEPATSGLQGFGYEMD
ncbi:hypothetical protein [Varibaculum timonense]|uniref:hypothetical protein n=1 Tax=Varibaculum timonense TaxID=1964383 RepID=UPI0022E57CE4|nr:hypothetical protein [Varibaculum timonense]